MIKKALLFGAVGGLAILGYHAQKYVRMFLAFRDVDGKPDVDDPEADRDLDEMLKTGDAVKVRISTMEDDGDEEDED
jgi:hypothetical protein